MTKTAVYIPTRDFPYVWRQEGSCLPATVPKKLYGDGYLSVKHYDVAQMVGINRLTNDRAPGELLSNYAGRFLTSAVLVSREVSYTVSTGP